MNERDGFSRKQEIMDTCRVMIAIGILSSEISKFSIILGSLLRGYLLMFGSMIRSWGLEILAKKKREETDTENNLEWEGNRTSWFAKKSVIHDSVYP